MSINLMLTDDHILMREGIRELLKLDDDIVIIEEAGDGKECIEKLQRKTPDLLLLDINMPKMNGFEVLKKIRDSKMNLKVLILTLHTEIDYLLKAVDFGVDGYILKNCGFSELKKAIHAVMDGKNYIQPDLVPALSKRKLIRNADKEKIDLLTKRELEVLVQVSNGMFNKEIATLLNISERTVKNHLSNIFKKIDVSDRTQAAVFSIKNNLINL